MEVEFSSHFLSHAKKLTIPEQRRLSERIEWFRKDHHDPRLKTHALTGKLKGMYAFSLTYGQRVTLLFVDDHTALFIDVGSHELIYR
jgi:mRNA-degrading endonuclease YafQ of YafQ-DinJ toxin-antitoxin module